MVAEPTTGYARLAEITADRAQAECELIDISERLHGVKAYIQMMQADASANQIELRAQGFERDDLLSAWARGQRKLGLIQEAEHRLREKMVAERAVSVQMSMPPPAPPAQASPPKPRKCVVCKDRESTIAGSYQSPTCKDVQCREAFAAYKNSTPYPKDVAGSYSYERRRNFWQHDDTEDKNDRETVPPPTRTVGPKGYRYGI